MATTEEMSGHEIAGDSGSSSAVFSAPTDHKGVNAGEGYGGFRFGAATFGGGAKYSVGVGSVLDEEYSGHEIGGTDVNILSVYPISNLPAQTYGCGNGYAGGPIAAMMYGGAVPCTGVLPQTNPVGSIKSNVEEFCILEYSCGQ